MQFEDSHVLDGERVQKVLANAGVASRRACENLMTQGRVKVNGCVVTQLGTRMDPHKDQVHVDGKRIFLDQERRTYAVNKPVGVVSTMSDPQGRPNLGDLAEIIGHRVYHIGRLDEDTSGLILMSNDGELAHRIMHPSHQLPKTYIATLDGSMKAGTAKMLMEDGIELEDGHAQVDDIVIMDRFGGQTLVRVTLHIGRNRIVRRIFDAVGHRVHKLARTHIGPIALNDLELGEYRQLPLSEVTELYYALDL